jgi:8-oxo-dGTP pyrophosphatase MutT (NUDIX family)
MAVRRVTARVLPVSPDGAVLLLEERDPARPDRRYWSTLGGAIDAGESPAEAAAREAHEEAGLTIDTAALIGPVIRHRQAYSWGGVDYDGDHHYFAFPQAGDVVVSLDHLEPEEVGNVFGGRWWTPDDLAAGATFEPPVLPDIMRAAVAAVRGEQ